MRRGMRLLALGLLLGVLASLMPMGLAEEEEIDISQWAAAQETAGQQADWAAMFGAQVELSETASNITKKCKFKVSEGKKDRLTSDRLGSPWRYEHSDAWVGIQLPEDETPGAIRIEWSFDPTGYELIEYDAQGNALRTRTQDDCFPNICTLYPLLAECRSLRLNMTAKGQAIGRITLYSEGILPPDVQTWLPPQEKVDMMVFSTHQDDEVIFLGGTIPYSDVVCGRPTITVYMTNCSRERRREALECLWAMGCRHYPEFINLEDEKVSSIEKGVKLWGGQENILKEMVERIRRYKPEVIVTQDLDGEYGHNQHKIMARAMQPAIEAAADPTRFPESYEKYGAWQVKKLYLHLYKENQIRMDWNTPQPACGGLSLLEVARKGMEKHASQTKYYKVKDGGEYDNALYGLAVTTVGADVEKNDFFENIPLTASADYLAERSGDTETADFEPEAPEEAPEEVEFGTDPEPAEEAFDAAAETAEPVTLAPVATEAPQLVDPPAQTTPERRGGGGLAIVMIAAGLAVAGGGAWLLLRPKPAKKRRKRKKTGNSARKKPAAKAQTAATAGRHAGKHAK